MSSVFVGEKIIARCEGFANPHVESYKWWIDGEIYESENYEIILETATKWHNSKKIACEAKNEIGAGNAETMLDVKCKYY